jgi:hypothetical protein
MDVRHERHRHSCHIEPHYPASTPITHRSGGLSFLVIDGRIPLPHTQRGIAAGYSA